MIVETVINLPKHEPNIRRSKEGYEFDLKSASWKIGQSHYVSMQSVPDATDPNVITGMALTLARMAEEVSPSHVNNCFYYFVKYFLKTPHYTGGEVKNTDILNLKASLSKDNEYKLGTIRALLRNWIEWGYPGLHSNLEPILNSLTLRGNVKGKAVLHSCPHTGPFTITEQQILLNWAANAFVNDHLTLP